MTGYPIVDATNLHPVNEFPMNVPCPQCKQIVSTKVEFSAGALTYLLSIIMIVFGFICCACIPCVVDSCKDAYHYCPHCRHYFGVYKRLTF